MNAVQKRKTKKIAYRKLMRKKIVFIQNVQLGGMCYDEIVGQDNRGRGYNHLTNFEQWERKTYHLALMTYSGNRGQFGLSDVSVVGNFEEGFQHPAPDMGALFFSGPRVDMYDFWEHFRRVEDELTRFTRRERQRNPALANDSKFRTFRCPRV